MLLRRAVVMVTAVLALQGISPSLSRAATEEDVRTVGEQLVCYCGCSGQTVAACSCGTADAIRERIAGQLDSGLGTDQVVAAWVEERGEQILAVPTTEGFNLVGWVMPFVATLLALIVLTALLVRRRHAPAPAGPAAAAPGAGAEDRDAYLERIESDLRRLRD